MKKLLFSFFLTLSLSLSVVGQISLVGTLPPNNGYVDYFKTSSIGYKYLWYSQSNTNNVTIYNSDFSIYKNIQNIQWDFFYSGGSTISVQGFLSFSDNLFNNDNLIEFLVYNSFTLPPPFYSGRVYSVMNENGNVIYTFPDTITDHGIRLYKTPDNVFRLQYRTTNGDYKFYSLPGTLPCDQCSGISGLVEPNTGGLGEMKVYPNPFNNTLQVNYDFPTNQINPRLVLTDILGRELKEIKLTSQSDNVSINTSDLPKGTIIVSLFGGQNMISKKVIKID